MIWFRLKSPSVARTLNGTPEPVLIPAGSQVGTDDPSVLGTAERDTTRIVTVQWDGVRLGLCLFDLQTQGERIDRAT